MLQLLMGITTSRYVSMRSILMPHWSLLPVLRIWPEEADNRQRGDWDHKGESPALIHLLRCAVVADHSVTTGFPSLPTRRLANAVCHDA